MSVASKLQLKPAHTVTVVGLPDGVDLNLLGSTASWPEQADAVIVFVRDRAELDAQAGPALAAARRDALAWIAYPKAGKLGTDPSVMCESCGWISPTPGAGSAGFAEARHAGASPLTWRQLLREVVETPQLWFTREVVHAAATAVMIADAPLPDRNHDIDWMQHAAATIGALEPLAGGAWYLGLLLNGCPHRGYTT